MQDSERDEALVERAQRGDAEATEQLLRRYAGTVRAHARRFFLAGGETDDLVQEGMIGLYAAVREYRRMILAQGKSQLVSRPIKPLDDDLEVYQLPESFSRDDLRRLKESKDAIDEDAKAYEEEHKNDEQYVEYNKQFEELERALEGDDKKKKKLKKAPKMLNKR